MFVALTPPDAVRQAVARAAAEWLAGRSDVRQVAAQGMHLTLAFLGEVVRREVQTVSTALTEVVAGHADFELQTESWGRFPPRGQARVYWLGLRESAELDRLARSVRGAIEHFLAGPAERRFRAHLTVARVRRQVGEPPPRVPGRAPQSWSWPAGSLELIRSRLGPNGARYEVLERYELASRRAVAPGIDRE